MKETNHEPRLTGGSGPYVYTQSDVFYDTDPTTPAINSTVGLVETGGSIITKHLSGIEYYNLGSAFTVNEAEPLEKEVAIDPEMLGKVFENLLEVKDRKSKGTYYTPREIVHYMCQQSLVNYLDVALNKTKKIVQKKHIEKLIHIGDQAAFYETAKVTGIISYKTLVPKSIQNNARLIDDKLAKITVCDPAVGSGAFPVGMMTEIVRARSSLTPYFNDVHERNPYKFKHDAIQNSLYGVDIDPEAVEIAKLRLWLSLVVDEEETKRIRPLPNLDYKIVQGNSLIGFPFKSQIVSEIEKLKTQFFDETNHDSKTKLKSQIDNLLSKAFSSSKTALGYEVDFDFKIFFSEVFHEKKGFDVVIANPPYVSTKGRNETDKSTLKEIYGFADDLYSHFYFKAIEITAEEKGIITFISSKTFWTIQTKRNLRELFLKNRIIEIYDTANPFEAMVNTCVILIQKNKNCTKDYSLTIKDGKQELLNPKIYKINIQKYIDAVNKVIFIPSKFSLIAHDNYNKKVNVLMEKYWDKIRTSRDINLNKNELDAYRNSLKPGDITLLGLITNGGVGLQTGNNGKYVGVLKGTKYGNNVILSRPKKLLQAIASSKIQELEHIEIITDSQEYLSNKTELEIRELFDSLKEKYGRDIFGRGYLFRIVSKDEIVDVNALSDKEMKNGIAGDNRTFVPYDKGDREGNRWYLRTPYYINWCEDNVSYLKINSGKKGQGMPVVRNPNFYFREGFCWSDIHTILIKSRLKTNGIHDVKSMSLFSLIPELCPERYLIVLLNSTFISKYDFTFCNNTSSFQINDARQLPIVIPTNDQLNKFENIFKRAYIIKQKQFNEKISYEDANNKLEEVQIILDGMIYKLYGLTPDEIKTVEGACG